MICDDCRFKRDTDGSRRLEYALVEFVNAFLPWRCELLEMIIPPGAKVASIPGHGIVKTRPKLCFIPRWLCMPEVLVHCTMFDGRKRLKWAQVRKPERECIHEHYAYRACLSHDVCSILTDMYPDDSFCLNDLEAYLRTDVIHDDPYFWEIFSIALAEEVNHAFL